MNSSSETNFDLREGQSNHSFASNHSEYPSSTSVHCLFEATVGRAPGAVALQFRDSTVTYSELNSAANKVAHRLIESGVRPGNVVGLFMNRSIEMISGILGILKAGAVYAPFDTDYPAERLDFMIKDTVVQMVITHSPVAERLETLGVASICIDGAQVTDAISSTNPGIYPDAGNVAYIMYTSGSTGTPKGVCVPHRGIVRLVRNTNYISITAEDVFLQFASISFDASTFEIWGALLNGARLVLVPPGIPTLAELAQHIRSHQVTVLWLTSNLFQLTVLEGVDCLCGLKYMLTGGDVVPGAAAQAFFGAVKGCTLINGYGPTESTTFACCYVMSSDKDVEDILPIGVPISNTSVYILDPSGAVVPVGEVGELCIGGDGLAVGYLNRPELTTERFGFPIKGDAETRLYKTGDMARMRSDGNIEFLGRNDSQIKIRGFRVELGEIEAALHKHECVRQAVVIAADGANSEKRLVACIIADEYSEGTEVTLRSYLAGILPRYCIPAEFVFMNSFPMSPNGKVDRKSLSLRSGTKQKTGADSLPHTRIEIALVDIWKQLFNADEIGITDNFFQLGGHSILAIRMLSHINKRLDIKAPISLITAAPTINLLAKRLSSLQTVDNSPSLHTITEGGSLPPIFCMYRLDGLAMGYRDLAMALGPDYPVYGLTDPAWSSHAARTGLTIEQIGAECAAKIVSEFPDTSYILAGSSFGGVLAYEVAQQLKARGGNVLLLVMFDAFAPAALRLRRPKSKMKKLAVHFKLLAQMPHPQKLEYLKTKVLGRRSGGELLGDDGTVYPDAMPELLDGIQSANIKAMWNYNPLPCSCPKIILRSRDRSPFRDDNDPKLWWGDLVDLSEIVEVPGDHVSLIAEPYVQTTAERIRMRIQTELDIQNRDSKAPD